MSILTFSNALNVHMFVLKKLIHQFLTGKRPKFGQMKLKLPHSWDHQ